MAPEYEPLEATYSWSKFGREAEYVAALYLKSLGWRVRLSKGSRGPADITACKEADNATWLIQVKASSCLPRLKGSEVKRLLDMTEKYGASPVVATLQPNAASHEPESGGEFVTGRFALSFYLLDGWTRLNPAAASR